MIEENDRLNYPIIKVNSLEDIDNHSCLRVKNFQVCSCIFVFPCHRCHKELRTHSIIGAKFRFLNGCVLCCPKCRTKKKSISTNLGERFEKKRRLKDIGDIGEDYTCLHLKSLGFLTYKGDNGNEEHIDLFVYNPRSRIFRSIQVKTSQFNHNNFRSRGGRNMFYSEIGVPFDFLVCYMENYKTFWVFPREVLLKEPFLKENCYSKVVVSSVPINVYNIGDKRADIYPYENSWHLIEDALR